MGVRGAAGGWGRGCVVNVKFGHGDRLPLRRGVRAPRAPFAVDAPDFRIRHLYHDREEFTLVGEAINHG